MMPGDWLTNAPDVAAKLRGADKTYRAARKAAEGLPLAAKINALRDAKLALTQVYNSIAQEAACHD